MVGSIGGRLHSHWWRLLGSLSAALTVNLSLVLHLSRGILHCIEGDFVKSDSGWTPVRTPVSQQSL